MSLSITLMLLASTTGTTTTDPIDPMDKVKCVREQVTGSLVVSRKVCHTLREWRRISDDAQEEARRIRQPGTKMDAVGGL